MKRSSILFLASALTAMPMATFAATGSVLQSAANAWSSAEQTNISEDAIDHAAFQAESTTELFPDARSSSSAGSTGIQKQIFLSVTIDGSPVTLTDVPMDQWFAPYIRAIAEKGIVSGYRDATGKVLGLFGPGDHVTVEQLAKVALASSGVLGDCDGTGSLLNAAATGTWSASYIHCSEQHQWSLYADGSVDIHRNATRSEVVITLLQAFNAKIGDSTGTAFTDVTSSTLYNPIIEQAKKDGIVSGYTDAEGNLTGLFGPNDPVTRAELSKMVTLAMQVYGSHKSSSSAASN